MPYKRDDGAEMIEIKPGQFLNRDGFTPMTKDKPPGKISRRKLRTSPQKSSGKSH